jgi:hypothetical protein
MANTYEAIATHTTTGTVSSYTFSSIPSTYTDAIIVINDMGADTSYKVNINSDTGSNYSSTFLYGDGSSAASGTAINATAAPTVGRRPGNTIIQFQNYSNTTTNKTFLTRGNASNHLVIATISLWRSTSAINSITITPETGSFGSGVTFSLYGVASATISAKATGGDIIGNDGVYYYHAFKSSGTFTPLQSLSCDIITIGGGGGGGTLGGGGGAGGLLYSASQLLTATAYTVTIGAGGVGAEGGGTASGGLAQPGNNTSLGGSFTAIGGGAGGSWENRGGTIGGSGGGAAGSTAKNGSAGTAGQGNNGGNAVAGLSGAGGGGAGAVGGNSVSTTVSGPGGDGTNVYSSWLSYSGSGINGYIAAGGGGGNFSGSVAAGGLGGGGTGGNNGSTVGGNGAANTGSGAGSGGFDNSSGNKWASGGTGGSGIVIVRYPI